MMEIFLWSIYALNFSLALLFVETSQNIFLLPLTFNLSTANVSHHGDTPPPPPPPHTHTHKQTHTSRHTQADTHKQTHTSRQSNHKKTSLSDAAPPPRRHFTLYWITHLKVPPMTEVIWFPDWYKLFSVDFWFWGHDRSGCTIRNRMYTEYSMNTWVCVGIHQQIQHLLNNTQVKA